MHACLEATGQYGDGIAEYLYEKERGQRYKPRPDQALWGEQVTSQQDR